LESEFKVKKKLEHWLYAQKRLMSKRYKLY